MARKPRVILPNTPHHVVQRGHNRNVVFASDEDYLYYLDTLLCWKTTLGVKVYSWCLMTNHVHLILDPGDNPTSISLLMKRLAARQTRRVNKLEGRTGSLWEGRYKLSPIETDEYLLQCCRYVELNPVKAGMVESPDLYRWSSFNTKIRRERSPILDLDECYNALDNPAVEYREFVSAGIGLEENAFFGDRLARNQLTGNAKFIEEVERRSGIRIEARGQGRPGRKCPA